MNRILILALTSSLLSAPMMAAVSPAALAAAPGGSSTEDATPPKTEAGIRCLLGLGPDGCWRSLEPSRRVTINACGTAWGHECTSGPLESIEYLGTNATGDDVYSARFMHENVTYVLRPPGPDGKIARIWLLPHNYYWAAKVTSPADQARILYTRPVEHSDQASNTGNMRHGNSVDYGPLYGPGIVSAPPPIPAR